MHICPNNKENISAIYTIFNTGGYLLEEFIDDERIIERYEIILVSVFDNNAHFDERPMRCACLNDTS